MKKNDTTYDYTATAAQEEEGLHAAEPTAAYEAAPLYKGRSILPMLQSLTKNERRWVIQFLQEKPSLPPINDIHERRSGGRKTEEKIKAFESLRGIAHITDADIKADEKLAYIISRLKC